MEQQKTVVANMSDQARVTILNKQLRWTKTILALKN